MLLLGVGVGIEHGALIKVFPVRASFDGLRIPDCLRKLEIIVTKGFYLFLRNEARINAVLQSKHRGVASTKRDGRRGVKSRSAFMKTIKNNYRAE